MSGPSSSSSSGGSRSKSSSTKSSSSAAGRLRGTYWCSAGRLLPAAGFIGAAWPAKAPPRSLSCPCAAAAGPRCAAGRGRAQNLCCKAIAGGREGWAGGQACGGNGAVLGDATGAVWRRHALQSGPGRATSDAGSELLQAPRAWAYHAASCRRCDRVTGRLAATRPRPRRPTPAAASQHLARPLQHPGSYHTALARACSPPRQPPPGGRLRRRPVCADAAPARWRSAAAGACCGRPAGWPCRPWQAWGCAR